MSLQKSSVIELLGGSGTFDQKVERIINALLRKLSTILIFSLRTQLFAVHRELIISELMSGCKNFDIAQKSRKSLLN